MSRDRSMTFRRRAALSAAGATLLGLSTTAGGRDSTDYDTQEAIPIETGQDLQAIEEDLDADYVVQNDIELTDAFTPIAADEFAEFTGTLDGQGHEITGLEIDEPGTEKVGLFTDIGEEATVQDLHLRDVDVTVSTSSGVGALAGRNEGTVLRCSAAGEVVNDTDDTSAYTGGLVGGNSDGQIIESFAAVRVRIPMIGGPLDKFNNRAGGLVSDNEGFIEACYSIGDVAGDTGVGGFARWNLNGTMEQCFSAGIVSSRQNSSGFVDTEGSEVDCYWDAEQLTAPLTEENAQPLDTDEMTGADAADNLSGFDFEETWATVDDSEEYPVLQSIDEETQLDARPDQRRNAIDALDGDGSADDPYHIASRTELNLIEEDPFGFYVLEDDIDISLRSDPIGPFVGSLDGRGHELTGLTVDDMDYMGVFSRIYATARVEGVRATDVDVTGFDDVGGFVGENRGTVRRCSVEGEVSGIHRCGVFAGNATGESEGGGLIEQCWADGELSARDGGFGNDFGGFVGRNVSDSVVRDCYILANLTMASVGGFTTSNDNLIENCFAAVTFDTTEDVSGFCRFSDSEDGTEDGCYWDIEKSGVEEDGSDATKLPTDEMQGDDPQVTMLGFDFEEVWSLVEDPDDYPELRWEQPVVPAFTVEPENPDPGEEVTFDADPTSGTVESFEWSLGDGTEAAGETVTHTYDEEDFYQVTLTVETLLGGTRETTQQIIVGDALQPLPCGEGPPQPVDGFDDTLHRDVRGTGEFTIFDVQCLFKSLDHPVVAQNPDLFGFSGTGDEVDIMDVQALFEDLTGQG